MKIRTRIMMLFLVSIMLTTALAVSTATFFGHQVYYDKVNESSEQTLQAVTVTLEQILADIRCDIDVLFWNTTIQEKLEGLKESSMTTEIRSVIQDTLSTALLTEDAIASILFYDQYGSCCYSFRDGVMIKSDKPIREASWYQKVYAAGGEWIYETDGGGIATYANNNHNVISMMRTIKRKSDYSICGVIMVNIDEKTIQERIGSIAGKNENIYLISNQKIRFESEQGGALADQLKEVSELLPGETMKLSQGRDTTLYRRAILKEGDWQLISETRVDSGLDVNIGLIAAILGGNIVLMLLCWMVISRYVSRPLGEMARLLGAAEGVPEDLAVDEKRTDEISTLKIAYNRMLASIRELMVKTFEEEKSIQRGELELILSQVSPHFLYNTLDTISGMILSGDEKCTFELVQQLGEYYRSNLNGGQQLVTLKEELKTVQSYLTILNTRYGGTIQGEYHLPVKLENQRVLKLMLQPLVENAVHHGLRPKGVDGRIVITMEEQEAELLLSVWDNGIGMSQEKIQAILQSEKETTSGFGIFSIRQRIQLFYGVENAMKIESQEGQWTQVAIRIPLQEMPL